MASPTIRGAWGRITHGYHPNDYLVWDSMECRQIELPEEAYARNLASRNLGKGGVCRFSGNWRVAVLR